jgi:hypothetical protein
MPKATYEAETEKFDLTSLSGAFVELRKFNYGERLRRRDLGMKFRGGQGREVDVSTDTVKVTVFDFKSAIVDHNLEDGDGKKLDLTKEENILRLDPDVAQEIDDHIAAMNNIVEADSESFRGGLSETT